MKVTKITSYSVEGESGRGYFIVKVDTDAGHYGLGEIGMRGWGVAIGPAIEHLSELVVGADPWETERLWQEMFRSGFFPADTVYSCAISAIDIALWDIKGNPSTSRSTNFLVVPYATRSFLTPMYREWKSRMSSTAPKACRMMAGNSYDGTNWRLLHSTQTASACSTRLHRCERR